jgi:hypothetical protein
MIQLPSSKPTTNVSFSLYSHRLHILLAVSHSPPFPFHTDTNVVDDALSRAYFPRLRLLGPTATLLQLHNLPTILLPFQHVFRIPALPDQPCPQPPHQTVPISTN